MNHRPHKICLYLYVHFARIQTHSNTPARCSNTRKFNFRGLMHRINNQNCSYSSFRYELTVVRTIFHSNFILRGTEVGSLFVFCVGYPEKYGYPGTRSSKWHYPAGRIGSGLQNTAGTRFGRVSAGSYLQLWRPLLLLLTIDK